nr:hypothetical protein [Ignavibacteria bacterium]
RVGRWGQVDPLSNNEPSKNPYHYTSNNPVTNIDPLGLDDYYYSEGKQVGYDDRSWFIDWFVGDRYYVQSDQGNVEFEGSNYFQALSYETIRDSWNFVDAAWGNSDFNNRVSDAISKYDPNNTTAISYAYIESHEYGKMDQKHNLKPGGAKNAKKYLYVYNNIALNWREAGNVVWGSAMRKLGFSYEVTYAGAQIYSLKKWGHFDQPNEVDAFSIGYYNATYNFGTLWSNEWIR